MFNLKKIKYSIVFIIVIFVGLRFSIGTKVIDYKGNLMKIKYIHLKSDTSGVYIIPEYSVENGQFVLYTLDGNDKIYLQKGQEIKFSLTIDTINSDTCLLGYIHKNDFVDFFVGSVEDVLNTKFSVKNNGKFQLYNIGVAADTTHVISGKLIIE